MSPNIIKQTTDGFGMSVKFSNGTFYYGAPTPAQTILETTQSKLQCAL